MSRPGITCFVLLVLTVLFATGLTWLSTDDALEDFFKSNTEDYRIYRLMEDRFPSSDNDVFISVDAEKLFTKTNLKALQDLSLELQFSERVESVSSIFSLRRPLGAKGVPPPIIPSTIPDGPENLEALERKVLGHPLAQGRLLSGRGEHSQLALFIVTLKDDAISKVGLTSVINELKHIVADVSDKVKARKQELRFGLSGLPVMTTEIVESAAYDIVVFNAVGLLIGAIVCFLFFRRAKLTAIANVPALLAIFWCLGLFGWTGTKIDPLMNAVMPLVLVVTFNNAMHLLFAIHRNMEPGQERDQFIRAALAEVGPACVLTSITTSVALGSLVFSDSALMQTFGIMSGLSVLLSLNLVIVLMPLLAKLFLQEAEQGGLHGNSPTAGVAFLDRVTTTIGLYVSKAPVKILLIGTIATIAATLGYLQLQPRYLLSEMLPDHGSAAEVMKRTEERLGGLLPISVMIEWPNGTGLSDPKVSKVIAQVHTALENQPRISKVNSLRDLHQWARSGGLKTDEAMRRLLETVPKDMLARFVNTSQRSALVSGYLADLEAKEVEQVRRAFYPALDKLRESYPDFKFSLTGITSMSSSRSISIISQLSYSMIGAVVVVIAIIGIAFNSFKIAAISALPNLFALFTTGTWLLFINRGLDYATVVGLTVAFGLAVDDTIHVLNRYQIEQRNWSSVFNAIQRTLRLIGKVLILTTVILIAGISVTQLSGMPPTRQFGLICISTLIFALVADLVILPALLIMVARLNGDGWLFPKPSKFDGDYVRKENPR